MSALELRPALAEDAALIASLLNEISLAHYGEGEVDADEVGAWLREPDIEFVLAEREGRLVGYGDIGWQEQRPEIYWLDLRELPGAAAIGPLVDVLEARAAPRVPGAVRLRAYIGAVEPDAAAELVSRGYRVIRHAFRMRRELSAPVEEQPLPGGLELRAFRPEDEEAVYEATMDSFADHWEFHRQPLEDWRRWHVERPGTDTTLWFLAWEGTELAGICLCRRYSTEEPTFGWVSTLGVRPPWRRRGLARALLLRAFREFAGRGYDAVGLGVDGENTTGAVRLYEGAGMHVRRRYDLYERVVGDGRGVAAA